MAIKKFYYMATFDGGPAVRESVTVLTHAWRVAGTVPRKTYGCEAVPEREAFGTVFPAIGARTVISWPRRSESQGFTARLDLAEAHAGDNSDLEGRTFEIVLAREIDENKYKAVRLKLDSKII